jgi:hypothetical protein
MAVSSLPLLSDDDTWLLSRLPENVREQLPPEIKTMIAIAAQDRPWKTHPVDIRFSVPTPFGSYYVTLVAGKERRSPIRRVVEARARQVNRLGNVLFVLGTVGAFYGALITAALLLTSILE